MEKGENTPFLSSSVLLEARKTLEGGSCKRRQRTRKAHREVPLPPAAQGSSCTEVGLGVWNGQEKAAVLPAAPALSMEPGFLLGRREPPLQLSRAFLPVPTPIQS